MSYRLKEVFATVQGEGGQAGVPAVFVRFVGCNMWSGHDRTRSRDAEDHTASCPSWCDTDFRGPGTRCTAGEVARAIMVAAADAGMPRIPLVVFTGGEPMMQLDVQLLETVRAEMGPKVFGTPFTKLAVETNGTIAIPRNMDGLLDWICVSPKQPPHLLKQQHGNELKLPYPGTLVDPEAYREGTAFDSYVLTPRAEPRAVGTSVLIADHAKQAAEYCMKNPAWRLSLQAHKHARMP